MEVSRIGYACHTEGKRKHLCLKQDPCSSEARQRAAVRQLDVMRMQSKCQSLLGKHANAVEGAVAKSTRRRLTKEAVCRRRRGGGFFSGFKSKRSN